MIKKIAALVLCLIISMSICAFAEENTDTVTDAPTQSDTMPPEGMQPGGRRDFGGRGQRPEGGMPPPQGGEFQTGPMQGGNMPQFNDEQILQPEANQTLPASADAAQAEENFFKKYSTPLFSLVLLGLAFVFVIFYKRKTF